MSTAAGSQVATYKGRKYRVNWIGDTKYGRRAKLSFFDGSREFWVDASAITVSASTGKLDSAGNRIGNGDSYRRGVTAPHRQTCPQCGSRECSRAWDSYSLCDDD